jgi:hypothetical protein
MNTSKGYILLALLPFFTGGVISYHLWQQGGIKAENALPILLLFTSVSIFLFLIPIAAFILKKIFHSIHGIMGPTGIGMLFLYLAITSLLTFGFGADLVNSLILSVLFSPIVAGILFVMLLIFVAARTPDPPAREFESSLDPEYQRLYSMQPGSQPLDEAVAEYYEKKHRKFVNSRLKRVGLSIDDFDYLR